MELAQGNWLIVAGYFDPLTAGVAEGLRNLVDRDRPEKLLAVVLEGKETLLSAEARSVLVAALRSVDAVMVMPEEEMTVFIPHGERIRFVSNRGADENNSAMFETLVLARERLHLRPGELES